MWAICKSKNSKIYIRYIHGDVLYSFSRMPITVEQLYKCLEYAPFTATTQSDDGEIVEWTFNMVDDPIKYHRLIARIDDVVKKYSNTDKFEKASYGIYVCSTEGTSRLVRSKDRSRIYIAKRNNNRNAINSVCITNDLRERFFDDSKRYNGIPSNNLYCIYRSNGDAVFNYWSSVMDRMYREGAR